MQTPNSSIVAVLILLPLFVWRIYARFRRMIGRQRLSKVRPWITLTVFPLLVLLLANAGLAQPELLWWLAAGLAIGATLGIYGLHMTRFEVTPQGLFYTPNAHLGIALSVVFVLRIFYRIFELYASVPAVSRSNSEFGRSPLTLAVFGLLAGYYVYYAAGLVRWRNRTTHAEKNNVKTSA
ncbi:MAG TPA: hypothetical protein VFW00_13250 [Rhodocyclaceae bacterium]|nr:hypothetical protein [Rhodocyclaceae bacterium]